MFNQQFYHGIMRKYVVYFGTLFNDIMIQRTDASNNIIQDVAVPISYGPKQKFIARLDQNPDLDNPKAITLPRLSFEITNIYYDNTRKLPTINRITKQDSNYTNRLLSTYNPVPYNLEFALSIYSKNAEDGLKIVEQILPFFTPEFTSTLNLVPELGILLDIPVVLSTVRMSDTYQGSLVDLERRYIITTLNFTMKGFFFGPTLSATGLIKTAIVNMFNTTANKTADLSIQSFITDFKVGDFVYQYNGKRQYASGTVKQANSTYLVIQDVKGEFSTANNLLTSDSNAIGTILTVTTTDQADQRITIRPALLANGSPTSNVELSIPLDEIKSTDNYGISVAITDL